MMEIHELEDWRELAACLDEDQDRFFPDDADVGAIGAAKAICSACPVADECLTYAIETNQSIGIWGGLTGRERRKIRRDWMKEIRRAS